MSVIFFLSVGVEDVLRALMLVMIPVNLEQVFDLSLNETVFLDDFCAFL